jgi:hypothetical protein
MLPSGQNHVFIVKNGGFVAFAAEGTYNVLSIIDQTHLPKAVTDPVTKMTLGWSVTCLIHQRLLLTPSFQDTRSENDEQDWIKIFAGLRCGPLVRCAAFLAPFRVN